MRRVLGRKFFYFLVRKVLEITKLKSNRFSSLRRIKKTIIFNLPIFLNFYRQQIHKNFLLLTLYFRDFI